MATLLLGHANLALTESEPYRVSGRPFLLSHAATPCARFGDDTPLRPPPAVGARWHRGGVGGWTSGPIQALRTPPPPGLAKALTGESPPFCTARWSTRPGRCHTNRQHCQPIARCRPRPSARCCGSTDIASRDHRGGPSRCAGSLRTRTAPARARRAPGRCEASSILASP